MEDVEQDTLVLRIDTEESNEHGACWATTPVEKRVPPTQMSCISAVGSEYTESQITRERDSLSHSTSEEMRAEEKDKPRENDATAEEVSLPTARDTQENLLKNGSDLGSQGKFDNVNESETRADIGQTQREEAKQEAVEHSLECNDMLYEAFEVKEMDRSFVHAESSDEDKRLQKPLAEAGDESPPETGGGSARALNESAVSEENGHSDDDDDNRSSSKDDSSEENEELKEAMADEESDRFSKGFEISLPYKKPEQLSLQEFLARRRSKRASAAQQQLLGQQALTENHPKVEAADEPGQDQEELQGTDPLLNKPDAGTQPNTEDPPPSKRKSKLHEEILKAAAKVTPQLSRDNIIDASVDQLIQRAVTMNRSTEDSDKSKNPAPGTQLNDLKAQLKAKIIEQRRRIRDAFLERAARASDEEEQADLENKDIADEKEDIDGDGGSEAAGDDDELAEAEADAETGSEDNDEDSDIEAMALKRSRSQKRNRGKHKAIAIEEGDDEENSLVQATQDEELKLCLDDDEEDARFMHLSQTQKPKTQPRRNSAKKSQQLSTELFADDLGSGTAHGAVDEDLLALCSGKFATETASNDDDDEAEDFQDDNDGDEAAGDEEEDDPNDDSEDGAEGVDVEAQEEDDEELNAYRKSLRIENGEDVEDDDEMEEENETGVAPRHASDFFEGEAELSGSDVGSDDEDGDGMTEQEKRQLLKDLISENPEISDEQLQEQVKRLHFKYVHADDQRELRMYKEMLLADGDLHSDGPGRERRFRWTNLSNDFVGGNADEDGSDGGDEEEIEEEAKWKARRLELEKQKNTNQQSVDCVDGRVVKPSIVDESKGMRFDEDLSISRVLRDANKSLKIAHPRKSQDTPARRAVIGGFLNMTNSVLEKIADKVKSTSAKEKEGSQTTKNFVFCSVDKKLHEAGNSNSGKRPCTDAASASGPTLKRAKVEAGSSKRPTQSIFNRF
ncbi:claspin isoform 4-like [Tropilaelaps mercedesae]|uniref:Claspin isoform 4-like n=1 Tax=Tropilaelaps mercedesae TaxID=418985 RepID=A0A1V9XHD8_9ACAR|nr:claspin isoform 4-like [Tropilaelaps mercedesae]